MSRHDDLAAASRFYDSLVGALREAKINNRTPYRWRFSVEAIEKLTTNNRLLRANCGPGQTVFGLPSSVDLCTSSKIDFELVFVS